MSNSPILAIPEMSATQGNKHVTHNNAIAALEAAANDVLVTTGIGTNFDVSEAEATSYFVFGVSGTSGAFNIRFPDTINGNDAKRVFVVRHDGTTNNCTVRSITGGTTVLVKPGRRALVLQDGVDMYKLAEGLPSTFPYDISAFIPSTPEDNGIVLQVIATTAFTLAADFDGSYGRCETNPSASVQFTVKKNGSTVGTIDVNTSGVFTFATSGGVDVDFAVGDRFTVNAPSPQDSLFADVTLSFAGTRAA